MTKLTTFVRVMVYCTIAVIIFNYFKHDYEEIPLNHTRYFVKNISKREQKHLAFIWDNYEGINVFENSETTFLIIHSWEVYDSIFEPLDTGHSHSSSMVTTNTFDTDLVIAIIKKNNIPWTFNINAITQYIDENNRSSFEISYNAYKDREEKTDEMAHHILLISIPKGEYSYQKNERYDYTFIEHDGETTLPFGIRIPRNKSSFKKDTWKSNY